MKYLTVIVLITFLTLSVVIGVCALILKRIDLGCLSFICGGISYVAYKDFVDSEL
jgi:hypothetical protein